MARWYDDFAALDEPDTDYLGTLRAQTERLMAQALRRDEETHALIVIDNEAGDAWIASARAEYDVEQVA